MRLTRPTIGEIALAGFGMLEAGPRMDVPTAVSYALVLGAAYMVRRSELAHHLTLRAAVELVRHGLPKRLAVKGMKLLLVDTRERPAISAPTSSDRPEPVTTGSWRALWGDEQPDRVSRTYATRRLEPIETAQRRKRPEDEPEEPFERLPLDRTLLRLLEEQSLLVLGPKGSGKTTLGRALLNTVISRRWPVAIIDPHAKKNPWPAGVPTYGSGMNYAEADAALLAVYELMRERYNSDEEHEHVYVFIDEVPSLQEECAAWGQYAARLLREARKVNIHLVVLSQSYLVSDLGLNTNTRSNFTVLALGKAIATHTRAMRQLREYERNQLIGASRGVDYIGLLDDGGVPALCHLAKADRVTTQRRPIPLWLLPDAVAPMRVRRQPGLVSASVDDGSALLEELLASTTPVSSVLLQKPSLGAPRVSEGAEIGSGVSVSHSREIFLQFPLDADVSETAPLALRIIRNASPDDRQKLGKSVKLFTQNGGRKQAAIMQGFELSSVGRSYMKAKELFDAFRYLEAHNLVK